MIAVESVRQYGRRSQASGRTRLSLVRSRWRRTISGGGSSACVRSQRPSRAGSPCNAPRTIRSAGVCVHVVRACARACVRIDMHRSVYPPPSREFTLARQERSSCHEHVRRRSPRSCFSSECACLGFRQIASSDRFEEVLLHAHHGVRRLGCQSTPPAQRST